MHAGGLPQPPQPPTPPTASLGWRIALALALLFFWFWLVLPVASVVTFLLAFAAVLAAATTLDHVGGYDAGVYAVAVRLAAFVLLPGLLIAVHRVFGGASQKGFRRWIPTTFDIGEATFAVLGLLLLTSVTTAAEWGGNPWLPDEIATTAVLGSLALFGFAGPMVLMVATLGAHWKAYRWGVKSASRTRWMTIGVGIAAVQLNVIGCAVGSGARNTARAVDPPPMPAAVADDVRRAFGATSFTEWSRLLLHAVVSIQATPPRAAPIVRTVPPAPTASATAPPPSPTTAEGPDPAISKCLEEAYGSIEGVVNLLRRERRIDVEDARDLAHEALLHVCIANAIDPYANLLGAFTTAARNRATDDGRRKSRLECGMPPERLECLAWTEPEATRFSSERVALRQIFCELPPTTQAAIGERMLGTSYAEIGRLFGMSEVGAKDLVNNALRRMRRELEKRHCPRR